MNFTAQKHAQNIAGLGRQDGAALFVTIVLVTVGLVIAGTLTYRHQLNITRNIKAMNSEQAILLALSAESWAKSILRQDAQDNDTDSLQDDWAQIIPVLPVEGGSMTGCIVDLQSRFNLNNLGTLDQEAYEAAITNPEDDIVEQYINLRTSLELDAFPEHAAAIIDWIDADTDLITVGSAEDAEYSLEDPPRVTANAILTSINELATVSGYSLNDVRELEEYVVALPSITAVNVNTAPPLVLQNISTVIDDFAVEGIIEDRPFEDLGEFYQSLDEQISFLGEAELRQQLPQNLISVESNFFELRVQVEIFGENVALTSVFQRASASDVRTLSRDFEYIPDLSLEEDEINPVGLRCGQDEDLEDLEDSEEEIT